MSQRQLHLNVNILNSGFHPAAWRSGSSDPTAFVDVQHYVRLGQLAERGTFDAVFLADTPSFADRPEYRPYQALEPTIVLATVAAGTERIGLIATASTTYNDPYNLARRFASLDLASGGRVGKMSRGNRGLRPAARGPRPKSRGGSVRRATPTQ